VATSNTAVAAPRNTTTSPALTPVRGPGGQQMFETRCFSCPAKVLVLENPPEILPMCERCRQAFSARRMNRPFCVRVASAALRWPTFCACCCRRANSHHRVSHAQASDEGPVGGRETQIWEVPYCFQCVEHLKFQKNANDILEKAAEELKQATKKLESAAKKEGRSTSRPIVVGIVWGLLVFLLGMGILNPLVLQLLGDRTAPIASYVNSWVLISFVFFLVGCILGGLLWYLGYARDLAKSERKADRAERRVEEAQADFQRAHNFAHNTQMQARGFMQPTCSSPDQAVKYVGWEGFTHVFYFDSETYAVAFVTMNRGGVVEPANF
jgi:hypothetical protein